MKRMFSSQIGPRFRSFGARLNLYLKVVDVDWNSSNQFFQKKLQKLIFFEKLGFWRILRLWFSSKILRITCHLGYNKTFKYFKYWLLHSILDAEKGLLLKGLLLKGLLLKELVFFNKELNFLNLVGLIRVSKSSRRIEIRE